MILHAYNEFVMRWDDRKRWRQITFSLNSNHMINFLFNDKKSETLEFHIYDAKTGEMINPRTISIEQFGRDKKLF